MAERNARSVHVKGRDCLSLMLAAVDAIAAEGASRITEGIWTVSFAELEGMKKPTGTGDAHVHVRAWETGARKENGMKQATFTVKYDEEKLSAIRQYMGKKNVDFEGELAEAMGKMYEKYVPQAVREYIESREDAPPAARRPARSQTGGGSV